MAFQLDFFWVICLCSFKLFETLFAFCKLLKYRRSNHGVIHGHGTQIFSFLASVLYRIKYQKRPGKSKMNVTAVSYCTSLLIGAIYYNFCFIMVWLRILDTQKSSSSFLNVLPTTVCSGLLDFSGSRSMMILLVVQWCKRTTIFGEENPVLNDVTSPLMTIVVPLK